MIKNHINTSLQRQRRRQRTKQVDKDAKIVAKSSSAISGTNKAADRTETTSRSWSDSLEDSMHPTRIIDRSLSVDRLPHLTTMPMSKSSSSSSATSYSTPVDALARSVSLESAATGTTSLDSSISETTLSLSDEDAPSHRHPMPSPTKSLSGACLASPTLPTRGTSEYRIAYHPYARGMHAAPRYTPQGHCSNPGNPTVPYSAPVYQAIRQRTRPTTPEMKGHLSYQHPVTELVDDVPASAPSSMQYFDVLPTTPARRYVNISRMLYLIFIM